MSKKVLCIEDNLGDKFGNIALKEHLLAIAQKHSFDIIFAESPAEAYKIIDADAEKSIDVVLLDIEFNGEPEGSKVADRLGQERSDIKIVVLTTLDGTGKKIQFGQKENVWFYFVKKRLADTNGPTFLGNLVMGLLNDPYNETWSIELINGQVRANGKKDRDKAKVFNLLDKSVSAEIPLTNDKYNLLDVCMFSPGVCIHIDEVADKTAGFMLSKIINEINATVVERLAYRTWGILDSKRCDNNYVKLRIGDGQLDNDEAIHGKSSALWNEIEEIKRRLNALENSK